MYGVKEGPNFSYLHVAIQLFKHHLSTRLLFPRWMILVLLLKISPITRIYFWTLNSISLISMFILMPVPHCGDYYCFVLSFEIGIWGSSNFGLCLLVCFKIILAVLGPSCFIQILGSACQFLQRSQLVYCQEFHRICRSVWGLLSS